MSVKRVLQCNVDDANFGGVFSLVMNVFEQLHKTSDIRFDFCTTEAFKNESSIEKIKDLGGLAFCIGYSGNKILKQFINFKNYYSFFKNNKYAVVHINADLAFKLFVPALAAKLCKVKKIIVHSHNSGVDGVNRRIKYLAHKVFKMFLPLLADTFLSCSETASKWMYTKSVRNIVLIKNGIDTEKFKFNDKTRKEYREKNCLENNFVIGHVGGFKYQKNHEFLIDIFEHVYKKDKTARLLLVGVSDPKENYLAKIREKVKKSGLNDAVIFWGGSYEIFNLYQMMDVFVFPSRFEGLGIVVIEAQSSGLYAVCSDKIPKEAKITELFVNLELKNADIWAEKILEIKNKNSERKNMKGEIEAAGYDINNSAKVLEQIYRAAWKHSQS
ncbi:MAG: glycosyltransferase [Eubacterium sp.]|jgi:glycosyltransferase involved in cell wall biosynthesis|nr:glycosyltransferase [Eubacterium sp.]